MTIGRGKDPHPCSLPGTAEIAAPCASCTAYGADDYASSMPDMPDDMARLEQALAERETLVSILAGLALDLLALTEPATLEPTPWPDRPPTADEERMVRDAVRRVFHSR